MGWRQMGGKGRDFRQCLLLGLEGGGERADAEIEPWAPNLNHSYWSKLTIEGRDMGGGGGSEQQRLWIGWQCWEEARGEGGAVDPPL